MCFAGSDAIRRFSRGPDNGPEILFGDGWGDHLQQFVRAGSLLSGKEGRGIGDQAIDASEIGMRVLAANDATAKCSKEFRLPFLQFGCRVAEDGLVGREGLVN